MQIGGKNVSRQKSVGFPAIFKKNLGNELWVRVVGHELPWSRDARIPEKRPYSNQQHPRIKDT